MNVADSGKVRKLIDDLGYQWTDNEEEANLIGIIACSVRQKAINKVYSKIAKWNKWKNKKQLITFLSGCILPADLQKFLKLFDIVFDMRDLPLFPDMIKQYGIAHPFSIDLKRDAQVEKMNLFWKLDNYYNNEYDAYIPIQNGCDKFCTYCAVPYTRGREVSRSSEEILQEVENLIKQDYKTITLLGQNVNSYGFDKKGEEISFPELLEKIGVIGKQSNKQFWVYFTSPHPRDMTDDVIDIVAKYKCLAKQIHIPMQSGDDKVLMRMNRQHNIEKYRKIIQKIKYTIPQATIFTDIIVGFTGETNDQFENTRKALKEFKFNMAYIAQYSPRPGAASSKWSDNVDIKEKKKRFHQLSTDLEEIALKYMKTIEGETFEALVRAEDRKKGYLSAQTEGKITARFKSDNKNLIGKFVKIKIVEVNAFSAEAEIVEKIV